MPGKPKGRIRLAAADGFIAGEDRPPARNEMGQAMEAAFAGPDFCGRIISAPTVGFSLLKEHPPQTVLPFPEYPAPGAFLPAAGRRNER